MLDIRNISKFFRKLLVSRDKWSLQRLSKRHKSGIINCYAIGVGETDSPFYYLLRNLNDFNVQIIQAIKSLLHLLVGQIRFVAEDICDLVYQEIWNIDEHVAVEVCLPHLKSRVSPDLVFSKPLQNNGTVENSGFRKLCRQRLSLHLRIS